MVRPIILVCLLFSFLSAQYPPDAAIFPVDVKAHRMGNSSYINNLSFLTYLAVEETLMFNLFLLGLTIC